LEATFFTGETDFFLGELLDLEGPCLGAGASTCLTGLFSTLGLVCLLVGGDGCFLGLGEATLFFGEGEAAAAAFLVEAFLTEVTPDFLTDFGLIGEGDLDGCLTALFTGLALPLFFSDFIGDLEGDLLPDLAGDEILAGERDFLGEGERLDGVRLTSSTCMGTSSSKETYSSSTGISTATSS
jgi:hypothetical protein